MLLTERKKIGRIERGDAVATPALALEAKHIIHTVGSIWIDKEHGEKAVLSFYYASRIRAKAPWKETYSQA